MFERILLPHDGSAAADAPLAWVARFPARAVRLLRVEPDLGPAIGELSGEAPSAWVAEERVRAERDLADAGRPLAAAGTTVETAVVVGDDPAAAILAEAAAAPADLIAMATHGRGAAERLLLGGVADRVARHAAIPVLVVRPGARPDGGTSVVLPLDGSPLAEAAVPLAAALAGELGMPLRPIRVVDDLAIARRIRERAAAGETLPDDAWERVRGDLEAEARGYLEGVAAGFGPAVAATPEVRTGTPAFALLEAVGPGDLVVMTSHGAGGLRRWLIGSVADKLVREAAGPVLLVPARAA